ncbi:MAG: transglutaminase domain-containing protein [Deltaproteobacteria bacterium]|nr:transglutaminase domain-containing protein [Deltaproteobacteria bacterium]
MRPSHPRGRRAAIVLVCAFAAGCGAASRSVKEETSASCALDPIPNVVTKDIQAGIEAHIEAQVSAGGGSFHLPFGNESLELRLVRVHTEYLANLGPRQHFACVDLVDVSGDVFDVDFFLKGDPGAMTVTETIVHKRNGQPFYAWEQSADGTWRRVSVEAARHEHLGVVKGEDSFVFIYRATLPSLTTGARMWLPLPKTDRFQTVTIESMSLPEKRRELEDRSHGNRVMLLELGPEDSERQIEIRYGVKRVEKSIYEAHPSEREKFLAPEGRIPASERFSEIARKVLEGKKGEIVRARALYDHVIDEMRYMKHGTGWGVGDAVYACDMKTGNCSDYHAYFVALARAAGIPARFAVGASIPSERNDGGIDGYHCWAEFYAEDQWWPVDISEGDKYSSLATYYFGHHPANRVELSRGRDLVVAPGPESGPINFLAYPVLEIDGRPVRAKAEFAFERSKQRISTR